MEPYPMKDGKPDDKKVQAELTKGKHLAIGAESLHDEMTALELAFGYNLGAAWAHLKESLRQDCGMKCYKLQTPQHLEQQQEGEQ